MPPVTYTRIGSFRVQRDLALLVVAVAALAVPFLSQPFHMDDNFYMDMARNARVKPLYPNDAPYVFEGRRLPDMGSHSHPPLHTYFLAVIQSLAGEGSGHEWIYHAAALVFPVSAVVAMYFISARFVERPLWPSLLLACTPLFLIMQHTLMTDVPTLAWWLLAAAFFIWGTDLRRPGLLAASGLCQFAAMYTSYQSVALAPLLGFYHWRKKGGRAGWLALAGPPAALAGWFVLNHNHYGRWLLVDTAGYIASRNPRDLWPLWTKFVALLQYQGWLAVFPLFILYALGRGLRGRAAAFAGLAAIYIAQVTVPDYRLLDKAVFVVGLGAGIFVLVHMGILLAAGFRTTPRSGFDRNEALFLGLWYFGVAGYCVFLFTEGSARYILPLLPPFVIYFFRRLEISETEEYRVLPRPMLSAAMVASGSLVLSLAWGLLLSHADLEFARVYPRAANEYARISGGMKSYYGGEWGFRYYFSRAGAEQLPPDESLVRGGSWLALPRLALPYDLPAALRTMTIPVQTLAYDVSTPLRVFDRQTPAGFYSSAWGLVPFSVSRHSIELVDFLQTSLLVERLPWARVETTASVRPWPGLVEIQRSRHIALLMKPDTRVAYPWEGEEERILDMKCGVQPGSCAGTSYPVEFVVVQKDAGGRQLAAVRLEIDPGIRSQDRRWHSLRLELQRAPGQGGVIEFALYARNRTEAPTGAFAEALLRVPR